MSLQTTALYSAGVAAPSGAQSSDAALNGEQRQTTNSGENSNTTVERRIIRVESLLILITIAAIAYGDYLVGRDTSLGYLYLVPLSYSALTQRLRTTVCLLFACVALRQWFGPLELSSWAFFIRDWVLTGMFAVVVTTLYRLGQERHRLFETARSQRDELLREVELAAQVQRNLLSKNLPPAAGFEIAAQMYPAKVVGGDYYDFIPLEGDRTGIVIADVAGKGLPAALLMPAVQIAMRALVTKHQRTEDILRELNTVLYESVEDASYATVFYGSLDASGRLRYTNAGHLPALLVRAETGEARWLATGGQPAGLLPGTAYESEEAELRDGDVLLLYTDGVAEAENDQGEQFGMPRLASLVGENRHLTSDEIVKAVRGAVHQFQNGRPPEDDLTLIAVKVPRAGRSREDGKLVVVESFGTCDTAEPATETLEKAAP